MADNRNIFQRIFNLGAEQKQSSMMGYFGVGSQKTKNYSYSDLANEGYLKNAIVYRCVNEMQKAHLQFHS